MTTYPTTLPDFTTQSGSTYKTAIDSCIAMHRRLAGPFAPEAQSTPNMTVKVNAGVIAAVAAIPTEVAAQNTGTITAPTGNPRKDIVYIDRDAGTVGVATGSEAASPSDPAVPAGKIAVARVNLIVSQSSITNADLDDLRALRIGAQANVITTRGDVIRGSSAGAAERLALGSTGQVLKSDGTDLVWGSASPLLKVGSFTRDISTATGTQAVTGVGFQPVALVFFGNVSGAAQATWGMSDGTDHRDIHDFHGNTNDAYAVATTSCLVFQVSSGNSYVGTVQSLDSDGFTISWTKTGSPTGTATINFLAIG